MTDLEATWHAPHWRVASRLYMSEGNLIGL